MFSQNIPFYTKKEHPLSLRSVLFCLFFVKSFSLQIHTEQGYIYQFRAFSDTFHQSDASDRNFHRFQSDIFLYINEVAMGFYFSAQCDMRAETFSFTGKALLFQRFFQRAE